ncbi:MAG: hypothetical protein KME10_01205 [Plectolyngbya sp. WJT66-NPBG17]|jgi:predicted nucleic acid-binding protein|nr:hypothetical protein [Plectolyngbya sp. WJT66-NPBG17]MBW4523796.1 hypothetical protein [Phormidium tanganyikae FI6-MK23]
MTYLVDSNVLLRLVYRLVTKYQVRGKQAHDTRLVAAMIVHQIAHLLTFNTADFKRFSEIRAIDPREVSI